MPIRLLSFDADGSNVRLIERDEIVNKVLPRVYEEMDKPSFKTEWKKAHGLQDLDFVRKHKQQKVSELLKGVMEQSAHYAILSHTWIRDTPGDITYKDWKTQTLLSHRGVDKITKFCEVSARHHGMTLGWIDSICINKESSSELDESIRSMYNWYRGAHICITYLSETLSIGQKPCDSWLTRGWTLQELLAPLQNFFYDANWEKLGSNNDKSIESFIEEETTITKNELDMCKKGDIKKIPISRRIQLACGRQVTREEDSSYSLMGILGVDISIAYGEGAERAFYRLLRELISTEKNILDLFNRSYSYFDTLIPTSLEFYFRRNPIFDNADGPLGSKFDLYQPIEPIILTHLGVRMSLLLVPTVLTLEDDAQYSAIGDFSAKRGIQFLLDDSSTATYVYNFLDRRLYARNPTIRTPEHKSIKPAVFMSVGILNFGTDNFDNIYIPREACAGLRLYFPNIGPGYMVPSDNSELTIAPGPLIDFQLKSALDKYTIPKRNLKQHGFTLINTYM